ncbi:MAG: GNAT family N-acetyltransferase [Candidatus Sericytochromatia bacterium]
MQKSTYTFRAATNRDAVAIQKLVFSVLNSYGLTPDPEGTDTDLNNLEQAYFQSGGYFGVIENPETKIVGSFGLYPLDSQTAEVRKMYLLPEVRGQGLGKASLTRLLDCAQAKGFQRLHLETNRVLKEAIALYLKFGFLPLEGHVHSGRCDQAYYLDLNKEKNHVEPR